MPLADEFWSVASQVVSERGYLVIGFSGGAEQPELGSSLISARLQAPAAPNGYGVYVLEGLEGADENLLCSPA